MLNSLFYGLAIFPLPFYYCAEILSITGICIAYLISVIVQGGLAIVYLKYFKNFFNIGMSVFSYAFLNICGFFISRKFMVNTEFLNLLEIN
jgi:hypothetical protein